VTARVLLRQIRAGTLLELLFSPGMDYSNDRDAIGLGWRILPDERSFDVRFGVRAFRRGRLMLHRCFSACRAINRDRGQSQS
jgi:hypothetical protein